MNKIEILKFSPCHDALIFRRQFKTFKEAWGACPRGDWMLWLAKRLNVDERTLFLAKGHCAKTVIHLMKDVRSRKAVRAAIAFGNGKMSKKDLNTATAAAAAYAAAAAAAAAARTENQKQTADICRKYLTKEVFKKLKIKWKQK